MIERLPLPPGKVRFIGTIMQESDQLFLIGFFGIMGSIIILTVFKIFVEWIRERQGKRYMNLEREITDIKHRLVGLSHDVALINARWRNKIMDDLVESKPIWFDFKERYPAIGSEIIIETQDLRTYTGIVDCLWFWQERSDHYDGLRTLKLIINNNQNSVGFNVVKELNRWRMK